MNKPFIVNFFTQRDYERIPEMIKSGGNTEITDPKSYGIKKKNK